jgi:hypothetical protein
MIKLICINDAVIKKRNHYTGETQDQIGAGLVRGHEYTATDIAICSCGHLCYKIAELNNETKLIERFREVKDSPQGDQDIRTVIKQRN